MRPPDAPPPHHEGGADDKGLGKPVRQGEDNPSRPMGHAEMMNAAAELGVPLKSLRVLSAQVDPFTVGTPAQMRDAEWFAELWHRIGFPAGTHLRRVHYRILGEPMPGGGSYENNTAMWNTLKQASGFCRWLELIDPADLDDRRNPDPVINARPRDTLPALSIPDLELPADAVEVAASFDQSTITGHWSEPEVWVSGEPPEVSISASGLPTWVVDGPRVHGYDYDQSTDQPLVEVWAEKSTMNDVLDPLCRRMSVNYVPAAGTQSITNAHRLVERSRASGRPVRVLYVSDYDKQGQNMPFSVARHVEFMLAKLGDIAFRLTPIVLTAEQVAHFDLPPDPMRDNAVELDALEALHPGELARIVTSEIRQLRDPSLPDRLIEVSDEASEIVEDAWQATIGHLVDQADDLETRTRQLIDRYEDYGHTLNERLTADIRRTRDEHATAARAINTTIRAELGPALSRYRDQAQTLNSQLSDAIWRLANGYETRAIRLAGRLRRLLDALVAERSSLGDALGDAVQSFTVDLPDRPGPALDDPIDRWLFASERDWLEQLEVFTARRNGHHEVAS